MESKVHKTHNNDQKQNRSWKVSDCKANGVLNQHAGTFFISGHKRKSEQDDAEKQDYK